LPAARFGVVDYLRERLVGSDLSQAYAAWQALQPMVNDDSRRVALAATEALEEGVPRVIPEVLDLGTAGEGEVRLEGSPIALTAVASSSVGWLRVEQDGAIIRVRPEAPEDQEASLVLSGPTGQWTIPVRLTMPDTESEPPPPPPEPEPQPQPVPPQPEPPHTQPPEPAPQPEPPRAQEPAPQPEPTPPPAVVATTPAPGHGRGTGYVPWWLIAVLIVGSAVLIYLNWPGEADSRKLWYDEDNTGLYVYRSWGDPLILSSFAALVVGLVARWAGPIALGIVAGCAAFVIEHGLLILGGGISGDETTYWLGATAAAAVMAVVLLLVLWPGSWPVWPVAPPAAAMVVAGGILLLVSSLITQPNNGLAFVDVTWLAVLEPFVTVALAWLALAATEARARIWLTAAAATYALISIVSAVPALTEGDSPPAFLTALFGNALVVAGVFSRGLRLQSRP
jgi:hypothetical protein